MLHNVYGPITHADVLDAARPLADEYGEALTLAAFERETGISAWHVFRLFRSWKAVRICLGLQPETPRRARRTAEQIQQALRDQVARHGENITRMEFGKNTGISITSIMRHFRDWSELRKSIGLPPRARQGKRYSEFDLMSDLWRVAQKAHKYDGRPLHRCPTIPQQHRFGTISAMAIRNRYGSWPNVRLAFEIYRRSGLLPPPEPDPAAGPRSG